VKCEFQNLVQEAGAWTYRRGDIGSECMTIGLARDSFTACLSRLSQKEYCEPLVLSPIARLGYHEETLLVDFALLISDGKRVVCMLGLPIFDWLNLQGTST
jgi:hypothetical protein